ncbi:MAG: hypothetical protein FJ254_05400 [Phycisphaerae bacterium]|nr:hypothetical protein [Phycisphaerae bacterium]
MKNLKLEMHFAAAAALCAAGAANAAIVAWENCNLLIPANIDGMYINVETQMTGTAGSAVAGWDINPYGSNALTWWNAAGTGMMRYPGVVTGSAGSLANGASVSATASYGSGSVTFGSAAGNWQYNAVNNFGFKFVAADGSTKFGYGTMSVGANATIRTITNLYYESSGAAIAVGAVPAPGALALLGLAGLASRRR